jgi:hypothetical protein
MARQTAEATNSWLFGLLGPAISKTAHGMLDLHDAVGHTAEKMAQYNGRLAAQVAREDVRQQLRDIERANRFGDAYAGLNERRTNISASWDRSMDKLQPLFTRFADAALTGLEIISNILEKLIETGVFIGENIVAALDAALSPVGAAVRAILKEMKLVDNKPHVESADPFAAFRAITTGFAVERARRGAGMMPDAPVVRAGVPAFGMP